MSTKYDKYISSYFHRTNEIIEKYKPNNVIKLQFFQRTDNCLLAGMDEVLDLLKNNTDTSKYTIRHLPEGTIVNNLEIVLELEGQYQYFGKYEGMIDGILSRSSNIATNARNCVLAANGKDIIFMGDRADHWMLQEIDGKACRLAGCTLMSTEAQEAPGIKEATFGSVPHCLIQNFDGDVASAMQAYMELFPQDKLISLVDYHNDVIADSLLRIKLLDKIYTAFVLIHQKIWRITCLIMNQTIQSFMGLMLNKLKDYAKL